MAGIPDNIVAILGTDNAGNVVSIESSIFRAFETTSVQSVAPAPVAQTVEPTRTQPVPVVTPTFDPLIFVADPSYIPQVNSAKDNLINSILYQRGLKMGVNTITPQFTLDVYGGSINVTPLELKDGYRINRYLMAWQDIAKYTLYLGDNIFLKVVDVNSLLISGLALVPDPVTPRVLAIDKDGLVSTLSLTSGSVIFSDGIGLVQDNTTFFWNNTAKRLGIGTNSPQESIHTTGSIRQTVASAMLKSNSSGTIVAATDGTDYLSPTTLTDTLVTSKLLTGLNATGTDIQASDSILIAFGKIKNQINGLTGALVYQGVWDASAGTPPTVTPVKGYYYKVSVAGATNLSGITDWKVGDWAIYNGTAWDKVDNTDSVSTVNGYNGAVSLVTGDVPEGNGSLGTPRLYYTNARGIGSVLTGYVSGAGTVGTSDTILSAIQKLNGNIGALVTGVSSVTGTTNRITASPTTGAVVVDIASTYVGQASITTLGTITTGTWQGTAIANTYVTGSTDWNTAFSWGNHALAGYALAASLAGYQPLDADLTAIAALTGTGLLRNTAGTWSLDPTAYTTNLGTVTTVSVVSANGFAGTVANATTTPAITISTTITGLLKGNGTAISAAVSGTDYVVPSALSGYQPLDTDLTAIAALTGTGLLKNTAGTWSLDPTAYTTNLGTVTTVSVVSANGFAGTVANATTTPEITISTTVTGLLKGNGTAISAATAGTDYLVPSALSGYITGSGITNYVPKFTSASAIGNSLIFDNGTNVGIGTTSLVSELTITNPNPFITLTGDNSSYTNAGIQMIANGAANVRGLGLFMYQSVGGYEWFMGQQYGSTDAIVISRRTTSTPSVNSSPRGEGASATPFFTINSVGRVGIGTTSPATLLHVSSTFGDLLRIEGTSTGNNTNYYTAKNGSGDVMQLGIANAGYTNASYPAIVARGAYLYSPRDLGLIAENGFPIIFQTGTLERMRITSGGNIGIGATNPASLLDVRGGVNSHGGDIYSANRSFAWSQYVNGTSGFYSLYNGGDRFIITTSGNVGINNTDPVNTNWGTETNTKQLSINASSAAVINLQSSGRKYSMGVVGDIYYMCYDNTAGRHNIIVSANGDVGINASPTQKLDVAGNIRSTSTIFANGNVTSGSGWQIESLTMGYDSTNSLGWIVSQAGMTFGTGGNNERVRITSAGNVGIGSINPNRALVVSGGNAEQLVLISSTTNSGISFNPSNTTFSPYVGATGNDIILQTSGVERIRVVSGGNVGIGQPSPSKRLEVYEDNSSTTTTTGIKVTNISNTTNSRAGIVFQNYDNNGAAIWSPRTGSTAGALIFGTNSGTGVTSETAIVEAMRIDQYGRVGIGTTAPLDVLHTVGDLRYASSSSQLNVDFRSELVNNDNYIAFNYYVPSYDNRMYSYYQDYSGSGVTNTFYHPSTGYSNKNGSSTNYMIFESGFANALLQRLYFQLNGYDKLTILENGTVVIGSSQTVNNTYPSKIQATDASVYTSNFAGKDLYISGGRGKGTGAGGSLIFQTSPTGSSGSTINEAVRRMTINSAGIVYIGETTVTGGGALQVQGNVNINGLFQINGVTISGGGGSGVTGSGTTGFITRWTSASTLGDSIIYDSASNIGIGNSSPAYKLDVSGTGRFTSTLLATSTFTITGATPFIQWTNVATSRLGYIQHDASNLVYNADTGSHIFNQKVAINGSSPNAPLDVTSTTSGSSGLQQWSYNTAPSSYRLQLNTIVSASLVKYSFDLLNADTAYTNNLVLDRGSVGIGTSSPAYTLDVNGTAGFGSVGNVIFTKSDGSAYSRFLYSGAYANILYTGGSTANSGSLGINNYEDNTRLVNILNNGNVGVGITTPLTKLHVSGKFAASTVPSDNFVSAYSPFFDFIFVSNLPYATIGIKNPDNTGSAGILGYWAGNLASFGIGANGTAMATNAGEAYFYHFKNYAIRFGTNNIERMRIAASGEVSINTTDITYRLTVSGTIGSDSRISASGSNGNGTTYGGYYIKYSANAASRSWLTGNDSIVYGDFAIMQSTTQTGSTYVPWIYINAAGLVGIGNKTTPAYALDVSGDVNVSGTFRVNGVAIGTGGSGAITGSGTANRVAKWSSTTSLDNSTVRDNGTVVTVGSDNFVYKFAINPISNAHFGFGYTGTNSMFLNAVNIVSSSVVDTVPLVYNASVHSWLTGFNLKMELNNAGQLFLGTTGVSGGGTLQVAGSVNITGGQFLIDGVAIGGGGGGTGNITGSGANGFITQWNGATSITASGIYFNGANYGIAMTSPNYRLDVNGSINVTGAFYVNGSPIGGGSGGLGGGGTVNRLSRWTASNTLGDGSVYDAGTGSIGIGNTSPSYQVDVTGIIRATSDIIITSDRRKKENVKTIENALETIMNLRGVTYNKIDDTKKKKQIGFIAQEVLPHVPEIVHLDNEDFYGVAYQNMVALLTEAIKEQQKQIEELKAKLK